MVEKNLTTSKESTVKDFLEVIFRRKWTILGIVIVATTIVFILNMREPAIYESTGRLMVQRGEATGVFNPYVRVLTWEEEIASQIEMIKSEVVAGRAREIINSRFPEGYSTEERLHVGRVGSGVVGTSNVLWVSYVSSDPVFCRAAADAVLTAYKEYYLNARTPPAMEDFFMEELSALQQRIEHLRERKTQLGIQWGIVDMEHQQRSTLDRLDRYRGELDEVNNDIAEREEIIRKLESFRDLDINEQAALSNTLTQEGVKQTAIERYTERLMDLRLRESELAVKYTDSHRDLQQVRRQIEDLYFYMDKEINSFTTVSRARLDILKSRRNSLNELIVQVQTEKDLYPERDVELRRIDTELAQAETQYEDLSKQHMSAKISVASNPEWDVTILSPASPAYQKKTRDYVRMALGPMFSLIVALGFAFFIDNLDHSIKNVAEAEETLGCQVLASFPDSEQ
jgi:uncharacterized protein involved in exopolysaccharide biosynthesis